MHLKPQFVNTPFLRLIVLLALSASAFGTTTVTGHISRLDTTTPGTTAYVRFWLRGTRGNQPRITGTGAIAPQFSGSTFYVDLPADASGNISGTIYSTRDATGIGAGDIEAGGSYTAVYYGMQIVNGGIPGPEIPVHARSGGTLDIANVSAVSTLPVNVAPNGDTTYARLDGGNSPFTGAVAFNGAVTAAVLNKEVWVDGANTTIQQAIAALPNGNGIVHLPAGFTQSISSCISITGNQIAVMGPQYGSATITLTADTDGFCAPKGTQNIRLENIQILTANGVTLTSNHAAVHLQDAPRPVLRNLLISTEATAGGCILIEGTQTNASFGPWDGLLENNTCQRTTPNQGTPDSALGHFGIWLRGNGGFTNADVSMNLLNKNWVENHGVGLRLTTANSNTVTRQHLLFNSINLLIESTSKDNFVVARLNQFRNSGSPVAGTNEHYNIDSTSNDNTLWLKLETPSTKGTDLSTRDNLMLGATDAWNIGSAIVAGTSLGFAETTAPTGVSGRDVCYGDSTNHAVECSYNNDAFKPETRATASGTATVDLASIASGACTADSSDVTLTGAVVGDPVRVAAATALPAGVWLIGRVTATNTGRFQLCNLSGGAVDRASDTYTISVVK